MLSPLNLAFFKVDPSPFDPIPKRWRFDPWHRRPIRPISFDPFLSTHFRAPIFIFTWLNHFLNILLKIKYWQPIFINPTTQLWPEGAQALIERKQHFQDYSSTKVAESLRQWLGGCKWVEFFWSKWQRSNLLIELQGSNGMRSIFIVFVVWLGRFAPFAK